MGGSLLSLQVGAGMFSTVTTALFPLSVIKTRQQALNRHEGGGAFTLGQVARDIWRGEGIRGFYRVRAAVQGPA